MRLKEQAELIGSLFDDMLSKVGPYPTSASYLVAVASLLNSWPHLSTQTLQRKARKSTKEDVHQKSARRYYLEKIRNRFRVFRLSDPVVSKEEKTIICREKYTTNKAKTTRSRRSLLLTKN